MFLIYHTKEKESRKKRSMGLSQEEINFNQEHDKKRIVIESIQFAG